MPLNWNDEEIPSKADKTTDILGLKEIGGVGQLIYHPFRFANYSCSYDGRDTNVYPECKPGSEPTFPLDDSLTGRGLLISLCNLASLICYAISKLAQPDDHIVLYEYNEKDLKELPAASLEVIRSMGNIEIINIDDEIERRALEENDSLRSPRFNAHLLDRLGERHCVLCNCGISEIIQGAHIWPVADIKRTNTLSLDEKLAYATDGENGLWMCQNHHKMFDSNILLLSRNGVVSYKSGLSDDDVEYINSITTVSSLADGLVTPQFSTYIDKRYSIA